MRLLHEAAYALGEPVISARLATVGVHALLDDRPGAVVRDDEPVQVEIEAVLDERAVHLGDEPAGARQRLSIDAGPFSELHQLHRRATRVTAAAAADGQADLTLAPGEAPLERAQHARGGSAPIGSGQTLRSLHEAHSAPVQIASNSALTRSTISKSSLQKPTSKLRRPSPLAPRPAPVRLALPA